MAGEGSRFLKEGWTTPKPLILLHGVPLFERAIKSVHIENVPMKYSFIVRQNHIDDYGIDRGILSFLPKANIYSVLKTTRGAVETCLMAEKGIDNNDAVIVMDCDLEFRSKQFMERIKTSLAVSGDIAEVQLCRDRREQYCAAHCRERGDQQSRAMWSLFLQFRQTV